MDVSSNSGFHPENLALLCLVIQAEISSEIPARAHTEMPSGFPPSIPFFTTLEISPAFILRIIPKTSTWILKKKSKFFLGISTQISS